MGHSLCRRSVGYSVLVGHRTDSGAFDYKDLMYYTHERKERQYVGPRPEMPEQSDVLIGHMRRYLLSRHLSFSLASVNGWFPSFYQNAKRIIIPCSNSLGVPYFQGRAMSDDAVIRYASPPASRDDSIVLCWPKDKALGMLICEGPMDALAAAGVGLLGVGIMGNQPNNAVLDYVALYARGFAPVRVLPDQDALHFGASVVSGLAQRRILCRAIEPRAKDLAAMSISEREELLSDG